MVVQQPSASCRCIPPPWLWIGRGNPKALARDLRDGHNLFVTSLLNGNDVIRNLRVRMEQVAEGEGKNLDKDVHFGSQCCGYASDNQAEIGRCLDNVRFQRRISESLKCRAQSDDGHMVRETPSNTEPAMEQPRANLPVGSVKLVIGKLLEEISILKPKQIALQTQLRDFDQKTMPRQIELWGDRIIPAVRKELAQKQAA